MKTDKILQIRTELISLTVFRKLLGDEVLSSLIRYFDTLKIGNTDDSVSAYCDFVNNLYEANGGDLPRYIEDICNNSENVYVKTLGCGNQPPKQIADSTVRELAILNRIANLTATDISEPLTLLNSLPEFASHNINIVESYQHRTDNIHKYGYGKYANNRMFYVDSDGEIVPVIHADKTTLDSLVDYQHERDLVIQNTKALLNGKPAANILLTGDAGTGKSSTIKAVGNEFYAEGLRILEIRKDQLRSIPKILDELAINPLKFILFIDDLSFQSDDDNFNGLKAVLEGSVSARSENVVIYATSNRRHIIRESFSDREGDEVHRNDTMQEIISLANRFGLHITFQKPDKKTYLNIAKSLAERHNIEISDQDLELEAERFALERGGRSARLAQQFVDSLLSK